MNISVAQFAKKISMRLNRVGIDTANLDARLIISDSIGVEIRDLVMHEECHVDEQQRIEIEKKVEERIQRKPIDQILGRRGFWSLDFKVTENTMGPRPHSETLIEAIIKTRPDRRSVRTILDLGTGTGCLLLSLLTEFPLANGIGVDKSESACHVARANAFTAKLTSRVFFVVSDWAKPINTNFDLVVANPPYVASQEIEKLSPEISKYEPHMALDGGADGLDSYRALAPSLERLVAPSGLVVFEIGFGQVNAVDAILKSPGFSCILIQKDLNDIPRALCYTRDTLT